MNKEILKTQLITDLQYLIDDIKSGFYNNGCLKDLDLDLTNLAVDFHLKYTDIIAPKNYVEEIMPSKENVANLLNEL